jgi:hypothetical protein
MLISDVTKALPRYVLATKPHCSLEWGVFVHRQRKYHREDSTKPKRFILDFRISFDSLTLREKYSFLLLAVDRGAAISINLKVSYLEMEPLTTKWWVSAAFEPL